MVPTRTKIGLTAILIIASAILSWNLLVGCPANSSTCSNNPSYITTNVNITGQDGELVNLWLNGKLIQAELVMSDQARAQGLSGRSNLNENQGMLFVFNTSGYYPFWMKEMNFPIDIVWLNKNWEIIDLTENLAPETYPNTVSSQAPAQYVLEIKAGMVKKLGIKIGQKIKTLNSRQ